ncbi:hypothetical protein [Actinotalea sp. Marseille-Q4924]|uniref:hypothetical protein n=1 Tax=Actinotalea sp. Marseille-Q4924 TaxID=2866571 RepID=UPI001CE44919|nr:hypothetical protein [Actinotalea sp. Marseille-Q4924]
MRHGGGVERGSDEAAAMTAAPGRRPVRVHGVLLLTAALLGACSGTAAPAAPPAAVAPSADCLADEVLLALGVAGDLTGRPGGAAGSVPEGFEPVLAVECRPDLAVVPAPARPPTPPPPGADVEVPPRSPDDGGPEDGHARTVRMVEVTRAGRLDPLLRALAAPSVAPRPDQPCPAMAEIGPELFLVAADGRAVRVAWPRDACGFRLHAAPRALEALPVVGERVLDRALD